MKCEPQLRIHKMASASNTHTSPLLPAIRFRDVSFSYGAIPILEDVNFTIDDRELLSMVGPNGGGKTTLLKLILGLLKPDRGEIEIYGEKPEKMRRHIGYMPQYMHFDPQFPVSVQDIVLMGRLGNRPGGRYNREDRAEARRILDELDLSDISDRLFAALSGGQRQRVLLARSLACNPRMLLLDEPTANVDAWAEARFQDMVNLLNKRLTILIVSHDLGFVTSLVKKVLCVNRKVHIHPTGEITGETIHKLYGENQRMVHHDHHVHPGEHSHE